jgi:hypothetical protein
MDARGVPGLIAYKYRENFLNKKSPQAVAAPAGQ